MTARKARKPVPPAPPALCLRTYTSAFEGLYNTRVRRATNWALLVPCLPCKRTHVLNPHPPATPGTTVVVALPCGAAAVRFGQMAHDSSDGHTRLRNFDATCQAAGIRKAHLGGTGWSRTGGR